jgi:hypothetical protein
MLFCNFDSKKKLTKICQAFKIKILKNDNRPNYKEILEHKCANWISYENYYVTQFNMYLESETSVGQSLVF